MNINRICIWCRLSIVRSPCNNHICGFSWMKSIPEQILIPILAWSLKRKTRNLAIVPPNTTTSSICISKTCEKERNITYLEKYVWIGMIPTFFSQSNNLFEMIFHSTYTYSTKIWGSANYVLENPVSINVNKFAIS